jgi:hypothetical protein
MLYDSIMITILKLLIDEMRERDYKYLYKKKKHLRHNRYLHFHPIHSRHT